MSDLPPDPNRESIPLLLARPATLRPGRKTVPPAGGGGDKPRRSMRVASARVETTGKLGTLRSWLGEAGVLLAVLLVLCAVFADMLASDLPIACKLHGRVVLFANVTQPAELVGLGAEGIAREAEWTIGAVVRHGPGPSAGTGASTTAASVAAPPGGGHPFGTDRYGRDVFARTVHGTRTYLVFASGAVFAALLLGGLLGAIAGLFGGATDALVGRAVETVSAFPPLVLVIGIQAAVPQATVMTLFLSIALTRWPEIARLVRAEVMQVVTRDYVMAARALGASPFRVLRKHVAPNIRGQLVVLGALGLPGVILIEASLDFLRVSAPMGAATWGETMSEFRDAHGAWWLLAFPGAFLALTVVALTLVAEARRDSLDPRSGG
ncbi:MAG TPA: ABC transporter permease [Labilithrix sp.]|nr:ABC transporter permease [Labilithrix sp.]